MVGRILTLLLIGLSFTLAGCQMKEKEVKIPYDDPTSSLAMAQQAINLDAWQIWLAGGVKGEVERKATEDLRVHNYFFPDGSYVVYQKLPEGTQRAWAVDTFGVTNARGVFVSRGGIHYTVNKSDILTEHNVANSE